MVINCNYFCVCLIVVNLNVFALYLQFTIFVLQIKNLIILCLRINYNEINHFLRNSKQFLFMQNYDM